MTSRSLLDFLDAPVVVGDPEGRAVYVNPAFEKQLEVTAADATGVSLANLFSGGGREAVLRAVASVCGGEGTVRFRLREANGSFAALASPIVAEQDRVGVLILLTEELVGEDRLLAFGREIQEPIEDLAQCLGEISETQRISRSSLDAANAAIEQLRKRGDELVALLQGRAARR